MQAQLVGLDAPAIPVNVEQRCRVGAWPFPGTVNCCALLISHWWKRERKPNRKGASRWEAPALPAVAHRSRR